MKEILVVFVIIIKVYYMFVLLIFYWIYFVIDSLKIVGFFLIFYDCMLY